MRFKLNVMQNGEQKQWIFDNVTNQFWNENGELLLTEYPKPSYRKAYQFTRENNENRYVDHEIMLEILLGLRCNFDCTYCSQRMIRDKAINAKPSDVPLFIELLKRSGIKPYQIQLWGGEPLVYWKTIKVLVPELRKLYPDISFYFPTNGSLLTKDKIDFIKENNISFSISHDGCFDSNRDFDVLEDPIVLDAIKYARQVLPNNKFSFGATLQKEQLNPEKVIHFFREKIDSKVMVGTHNVVRCHNSLDILERQAVITDSKALSEFSENIFHLLNGIKDLYEYSYTHLRDVYIDGFIHSEPMDAIQSECSHPSCGSLCVDIKGNILQCHSYNTEKPIGHLLNLKEYVPLGYSHCLNYQRCKDCLVVHGCKGGCPSSDDKAKELSCKALYAQHYGVFKSALAALFGVYLINIEKEN